MRRLAPYMSMPQYAKPAEQRAFKRVRARTPQRSRDERIYLKLSRDWLKQPENRWCAVCMCVLNEYTRANQVHHKQGRRGKLLNFTPLWIAVSDFGHEWIHRNPDEARKLHLLCEKGHWNNPPPK